MSSFEKQFLYSELSDNHHNTDLWFLEINMMVGNSQHPFCKLSVVSVCSFVCPPPQTLLRSKQKDTVLATVLSPVAPVLCGTDAWWVTEQKGRLGSAPHLCGHQDLILPVLEYDWYFKGRLMLTKLIRGWFINLKINLSIKESNPTIPVGWDLAFFLQGNYTPGGCTF